ncbi:MAG: BON domain-containing protein [Candidatus Omnitrophota bacterium]
MSSALETLKKDIMTSLDWDGRVEADLVDVDVRDDGTVKLSGKVTTASAREAAQEDAEIISGVSKVQNDLAIEYPREFTCPTGKELQERIMSILAWNQDIDETRIEVNAEAGIVTLRGSVEAYWKKQKAQRLAQNVAGVRYVDNEIAVVPVSNVSDERMASQITATLQRNLTVAAEKVSVKVENGVVTLSGKLPDRMSVRTAKEAAMYTPGVIEVQDFLNKTI